MRTTRSHTPIQQILVAAGTTARNPTRNLERQATFERPEEQQIIQLVRNSIARDLHLLPEPESDPGQMTSPSSPEAIPVPAPPPPPFSEVELRPRPRPRKTGSSERRAEPRPEIVSPPPPDPRRLEHRYDESTMSRARQPPQQMLPPDLPEDDESDPGEFQQSREHRKLQQRKPRRRTTRRDTEDEGYVSPSEMTSPSVQPVTRERGGSTSDSRRRVAMERPRHDISPHAEREQPSWQAAQHRDAGHYPQRPQYRHGPSERSLQSDREYYQRPPAPGRGDSKQRIQAQRQPTRRERERERDTVEKYHFGSDVELEIADMYKQAQLLSS
jgi:hypothetical protein